MVANALKVRLSWKVYNSYWVTFLIRGAYVLVVCSFTIVPRMDTKKTCVQIGLECMLQNMIPILGSIVNIIGWT
jgi:hypothetical protein